MLSSEVENIAKGLKELHCSGLQFAQVSGYSQPRLAEILRGVKQPGRYELALFKRTLDDMRSLLAQVRSDIGSPVRIVWTASLRETLENRRNGHPRDYGVGIIRPNPELANDGLTGTGTDKGVLAGQG